MKLDYTIERFQPGHPNYSDVSLLKLNVDYKATFGQILEANGEFLHYTMERRDTLIPEGTYKYCLYHSPVNGWVILLKDVPGFSFIEHHAANWPYQIKGCTAHGLNIDVHTPMIVNSRRALIPWFENIVKESGKILAGDPDTIIDGDFGSITYKTLTQ